MQYPTIAQPQFAFAPTYAGGGMTRAAQAVQSHGRGNDSMLVHMTPREVKGLQALAMANGGSLTINPATGLPEAGFLDAILPIVAGFALGPAGFALMSAPAAALTVGGVTAAMTGDLGKGLMAGLGAFGGANIGGALSSTGTQALQSKAMTAEVANQVAADAAAQTAAAQANTLAGTQLATPMVGSQAGADAILAAAQNAPTGFSSVGAGAKDLFTSGGFDRFGTALSQQAGGGLGATAGLAGVGLPIVEALQPSYDFPEVAEATSNYAGPYTPSPREVRFKPEDDTSTSEFTYFTPSNPVPGYEPMYAAAGGYMQRYQEGGEVMTRVSDALRSAPEVIQTLPPVPESSNRGLMATLVGKQMMGGEPAGLTEQSGMESMVRYQEGGNVEDRAVRTAPATYQAGAAPEFNHNFRPVEIYTPPPTPQTPLNTAQGLMGAMFGKRMFGGEDQATPAESNEGGGIFGRLFSKIGKEDKDVNPNYIDLSKYKYDPNTQRMVPMAQGGLAALNAFNKGGAPKGRFLQGAGDGTSDSIPATIGGRQPARLADGEFVIDARTVSEIGNGSSKAGAKKLYAMMERVHSARKKAKRGQDSNADRYLPA